MSGNLGKIHMGQGQLLTRAASSWASFVRQLGLAVVVPPSASKLAVKQIQQEPVGGWPLAQPGDITRLTEIINRGPMQNGTTQINGHIR